MELVDSNETLYYPYLLQRPEDFNPWINDARWLGNYSDYNDYSDYSNYSDYSYIDYDYRRLATGSPETYYWRVGLFGIGGTAVCCCGVICNIVAIIVLSRLRTDSSAPVLLMCLSGFDCLYLLSFLCLETLMVLCGAGLITRHYRPVIAPAYGYLFAVPLVCQTCTAYIVVVITLERFIAIVLPFRAQAICNFKWALGAVGLCVVFAMVFHIPDYLAHEHFKVWNNITQSYSHGVKRTEFGFGYFYNEVYYTWINLTVNFLLPFVLLLTLNSVTLFSFSKSILPGAYRVRHAQQRRLAFMVFSMTAVFFVCELLAAISFSLTADLIGYFHATIHINRFSALADTLMLIKSAVNFLIYCATGSTFRKTFRELFCRNCKSQSRPGSGQLPSAAVSSRAGRVRQLSSQSSSTGTARAPTLTSLVSQSTGIPSSDGRFRRSSSNASCGVGDGIKSPAGRLGSNSSGVGYNNNLNHNTARMSLSTTEASESCAYRSDGCRDQHQSPVELNVLTKHAHDAGDSRSGDILREDPLAIRNQNSARNCLNVEHGSTTAGTN